MGACIVCGGAKELTVLGQEVLVDLRGEAEDLDELARAQAQVGDVDDHHQLVHALALHLTTHAGALWARTHAHTQGQRSVSAFIPPREERSLCSRTCAES